MSELHTQRDHGDESRVIPRENPDPLPSQGSAPPAAVTSAASRRRVLDARVRDAVDRVDPAGVGLAPLIAELLSLANRECAARRVALRQSEIEVRRLRALVETLGGHPNV